VSQTVVLLGGPSDLTRMVLPDGKREVLIPRFRQRFTLDSVESAVIETHRYDFTGRCMFSDTCIFEWKGLA
jgi:hypothetical protein